MKAKTAEKKPKVKADSKEHRIEIALTAEANRFIPLSRGHYVWWFNPITDQCLHLRVGSTEFVDALRESCELGLGPRIRRELEAFHAGRPQDGWDAALEQLVTAGLVEA